MLVAWTGGNPGTYVYITGVSTSTPLGVQAGFTCLAAVDAQQFTVPAYVLLGLPASVGGKGLQNNVYSTLTATGLDNGPGRWKCQLLGRHYHVQMKGLRPEELHRVEKLSAAITILR